ncbi:hypothetical protein [Pandoraea eparura]|uniref:hypothetical protein n=1 Tax=Pandoraea eparura TaxID=2508291 RepID=UPI001241C49D|nr:hypothetical protein [Pandoraea eparura]
MDIDFFDALILAAADGGDGARPGELLSATQINVNFEVAIALERIAVMVSPMQSATGGDADGWRRVTHRPPSALPSNGSSHRRRFIRCVRAGTPPPKRHVPLVKPSVIATGHIPRGEIEWRAIESELKSRP